MDLRFREKHAGYFLGPIFYHVPPRGSVPFCGFFRESYKSEIYRIRRQTGKSHKKGQKHKWIRGVGFRMKDKLGNFSRGPNYKFGPVEIFISFGFQSKIIFCFLILRIKNKIHSREKNGLFDKSNDPMKLQN